MSAVFPLLFAWGFLSLSRWGRRNSEALVPVTHSPERRAREERRLLRGARSMLVLAFVCGAVGVAEALRLTFWN